MRRLVAGLLLLLAPAPAAAQARVYRFTKAPYLQALSSHGVSIRWEGSESVGGVVEVFAPDGALHPVTLEEKTPFHAVEVEGLAPSTAYTYRVKVGDVISPEGKFTTAPPDDTSKFSFLLYGDNRSDERAHAAVVRAMAGVPSDFLVHTGDMVENGDNPGQWASFFETESPLLRDRCVFACIGNHELSGGNARNYLRYFHSGRDEQGQNTLFYSVRWGTARFFFLNAFASWTVGTDRVWLQQELARAADEPGLRHRFVVMHQGPGSSGPHGANRDFLSAGFGDDLKRQKVTLVMAGHDHLYERGERAGIRYLLSGGGGAPLYKPRRKLDSATQAIEVVHHFVEVRVDGDEVTTTARRVDGSVMETCEVKPEGWVCKGSLKDMRLPGNAPSSWLPFDCNCAQAGSAPPPAALPAALSALLLVGGRLRRSPRRR